jgi:hypothetical protein
MIIGNHDYHRWSKPRRKAFWKFIEQHADRLPNGGKKVIHQIQVTEGPLIFDCYRLPYHLDASGTGIARENPIIIQPALVPDWLIDSLWEEVA